MDKFDEATQKAKTHVFKELQKDGFEELYNNVGSLFITTRQEGKINKAIILTVHLQPNTGTGYQFRRTDDLVFQDLLERKFEVYCYHYYFNEILDFEFEKKQVTSAGEILDFWDSHDVQYEI